jgi:hypothetical protein
MRALFATVLALLSGLASATFAWGWWRSPIQTFVIFTSLLQGMAAGIALMWIVRRFDVRSRAMRASLGVLAGGVSVVALAGGRYVSDAYDHRESARRASVVAVSAVGPERAGAMIAHAGANAFEMYDRGVLRPLTGHGGIIGHLDLQRRRGRWPWLLPIEAAVVVGVAVGMSLTDGKRQVTLE